jgi:8-oxo-dGTP diphosphatase
MFEEKIKKFIPVSCAIIINSENKVLLIRRSSTDHWPLFWEAPRGKCDKPLGESLVHCLKREVKEETGLDVTPVRYIGSFFYLADKGTRKSTQYNFLCKMDDENQEVKLSKEHDNFMWVKTLGEIELLVNSEMIKILSKVLQPSMISYPKSINSRDE